MAGHQVETDFYPASVGFPAESKEVSVGSVARRYPAIIIHIITSISERRHKTWVNPHRVDAQPLEVVQFLNYPGDVTNAVVVGIVVTLRVNLVKDGLIEPGGIIRRDVHLRESR